MSENHSIHPLTLKYSHPDRKFTGARYKGGIFRYDTSEWWPFQFNPEGLSLSRGTEWESETPDPNDPTYSSFDRNFFLAYKGAAPMEFSLPLYSEGKEEIEKFMNFLDPLVGGVTDQTNSKIQSGVGYFGDLSADNYDYIRPDGVLVTMGPIALKSVITNVNYDFQEFDEQLNPIKAFITISFRVFSYQHWTEGRFFV